MFSLDEILIINKRILFSLIDFDIFVFFFDGSNWVFESECEV